MATILDILDGVDLTSSIMDVVLGTLDLVPHLAEREKVDCDEDESCYEGKLQLALSLAFKLVYHNCYKRETCHDNDTNGLGISIENSKVCLIQELIEELDDFRPGGVPVCGVFTLDAPVHSWSSVERCINV